MYVPWRETLRHLSKPAAKSQAEQDKKSIVDVLPHFAANKSLELRLICTAAYIFPQYISAVQVGNDTCSLVLSRQPPVQLHWWHWQLSPIQKHCCSIFPQTAFWEIWNATQGQQGNRSRPKTIQTTLWLQRARRNSLPVCQLVYVDHHPNTIWHSLQTD